MVDNRTKEEEREHIRKLVSEWNASRLDIFEISEPNEDLEFRGVMRFFFQDSGSKVATKCIRVSSNEIVTDVTNTLVEKFRPDMKMLSQAKYALYEIHPSGDTRALGSHERPLQVQLAWQEDDREGRFLLKSDQVTINTANLFGTEPNQNFKRKLSKREKKQLKKKKEGELKSGKESKTADDSAIAKGLYDELPETSFTRSISNPEAVMRRRRQQKLEKRLKEFQSQDGGQDSGGTLKIFATTLKPEIPYKTLLVAMHASTTQVVKDALEKYQMEKEDPDEYCLVMVNIPPEGANGANTLGKERIVPDQDCPLGIAASWPPNLGTVVFHLRLRANLPKYRREKKRSKSPSRVPLSPTSDQSIGERLAAPPFPEHLLPYLMELSADGKELGHTPRVHRLQMGVTEVGSDRSSGPFLQLFAPHIRARHCVVTNIDGIVSIIPSSSDAETFVDGRRIYETTKLNHGKVVKFGRMHMFKFGDPAFDERAKQHNSSLSDRGSDQASISSTSDTDPQKRGGPRDYETNEVDMDQSEAGVFETTFDVTGEIKTNTMFPERERQAPQVQEKIQISQSHEDLEQDSGDGDKLPARLEFREAGEDAFFAVVISEVNGAAVHFKLSPTYTLYMCCRYRMSPAYRPELNPDQHGERLGVTLVKIGNIVRSTIRENNHMPASLAFWIANSSEMLHFLKEDGDISPHTRDGQQILASSIQMAFRSLVHCVQQELKSFVPAFLDETDDADMADMDFESLSDPDSPDHGMTANERSFHFAPSGRPLGSDQWLGARRRHPKPTLSDVLYTLSSAMSLLRRCRVNAAITIQVFTHLFHYINMWIFNKLVLQPQHGLCTRKWGRKLRKRLARVETWAQKQGLELAADRHLSRIIQAAHLLQAPKNSHSDINSISSTCFKLNSYQLRALLENYVPGHDEPDIPTDLINNVVAVAENTADELMRSNGQEVQLEEEPQLQLPFLLPEDGYSCDVIRGVPPGLKEFLEPLASTGLCKLIVQPMNSGLWTVYQTMPKDTSGDEPKASSPEVMEVAFNKGRGGMGLSIVAAKGAGQDKPGIYVKQVVPDGPAARDGRLQAGDQLVAVNGESLIGVSQERAAELMVKSGANVKLLVAKQGAIFHGLATLLSQPYPMVTREVTGKMTPVEPESVQVVQASPTVPEDQLQRPPTRWLQQDGDSQDASYKPRSERDLRAEERRRFEEEERRRVEDEQELLEEERRRAEEDERRREEARKLEEERRFAEERRKDDEERRYAEETQRLEEVRQEGRGYNGDWHPQVDERRRGEEAIRQIGQGRYRGGAERPPIRPKPRPAQTQESVRAANERQRTTAAFSFENLDKDHQGYQDKRGLYASPPMEGSQGSYSPNEDSPQSLEEPGSPLRIDARDTKFGRAITVRPSGLRSPTQPQRPTDLDPLAQADRERMEAWHQNEHNELDRWQLEERKMAEKRERDIEERDRLERERREQEERAWREKMDQERAQQEERDNWERERLNRERLEREQMEREKEERQRQERDRQALQAMMEEQRRQEQFERERREREERERKREEREREEREREEREREEMDQREEERIMIQLQREDKEKQEAQEDHMKQLEREQEQFRALEQQRWKSSKEMLDSIESMNPDEVEKEFQRRLQEDKRRRDTEDGSVSQERAAGGLVSVTRVKYHPPDREEQMERERKIQLILDEREKRDRDRKENEERRKQQEEQEEKERRDRQQRRMHQFEMEREQHREMQKKVQEQREREQAEWLRQQKEKREQQRTEQERQRVDQKNREEEEKQRRRQELLEKKEQDVALRRQSQLHKAEEEKRFAEEQRQNEARREQDRRRQFEEQEFLREKEEQVRRQQMEDERAREPVRKVSKEDHVNELKQRALTDYDRRRQLIDEELNRRREDKPPSVLKNSNSMRTKKQVSFSNVATEIREPSSPTYVVGTSAGYTARVTPSASVRYVHTRLAPDGTPNHNHPPAAEDDEDDLPPPPPPPPPEELLNDDNFPPPPPPKSSRSLQRFTALSGGSPSNYVPRDSLSSSSGPGSPYDSSFQNYADEFRLNHPQYRNVPVSSTGGYPSYITMPRRARPLSYPAALDVEPPSAPQRYGSQDNILDGSSSSQSGRPRFQPPQAARLDSDDEDAVDLARVGMARVSLTDAAPRGAAKPEKMGFRDKLKMFNADSPQDKVRASRWQRDQLAQMNGD